MIAPEENTRRPVDETGGSNAGSGPGNPHGFARFRTARRTQTLHKPGLCGCRRSKEWNARRHPTGLLREHSIERQAPGLAFWHQVILQFKTDTGPGHPAADAGKYEYFGHPGENAGLEILVPDSGVVNCRLVPSATETMCIASFPLLEHDGPRQRANPLRGAKKVDPRKLNPVRLFALRASNGGNHHKRAVMPDWIPHAVGPE